MTGTAAKPNSQAIFVDNKERLCFVAILILAAVLRFWHLNDGLWYDEILTLIQFVRLPVHELVVTYGSLNNHILYTWLAKASVALFGESPWALRLPAVFFGIGSIALAWRVIAELGFRREALVTALLLSLSFHHVWFSQNARGYTAILFFILLAGLYLRRAMQAQSLKIWALFGLSAAGALLVHLSSLFPLLGIGTITLVLSLRQITPEKSWRTPRDFSLALLGPGLAVAVCLVVTLIVFLPLVPGMLHAFGKVTGHGPAAEGVTTGHEVKEWKNPLWTLIEIGSSFGILSLLLPIAAALALAGAVKLLRRDPLLSGGLLLSIPITLAALLAAHMRIWPRYFFVDISVLLACVVIGAFWAVDIVTSWFKRFVPEFVNPTFKVLGTLAMIGAFVYLLLPNYQHPKQDFIGARNFVLSAISPGEAVVTVGLAEVPYHRYLRPDWPALASVPALQASEANTSGVWIVVAFPKHMRTKYPEVSQYMDAHYDLIKRFNGSLDGGDVLVWHRQN